MAPGDLPQSAPSEQPEPAPTERYPYWGYSDIALFIGSLIPSVLIAIGILRLGRSIAPATFAIKSVETLTFQALLYVMLIASLYMIVAARYRKPFAEAFRLRSDFRQPWRMLLWGPLVAIAVSLIGGLLHAPQVPSPVDLMIGGRWSLVFVGFFAVIAAPVVEELIFRGFVQPLLSRTLGAIAGVLISATLFALLHGNQSQWAWQLVVAIGLAGAAFGLVRQRTGSTAASIALHSGYNATFFAAYLALHWPQR